MKRAKRLERIRRNPRAVTPAELESALLEAGFVRDHATGSHRIYRDPQTGRSLSIPYRAPHLLPVYVKLALEAIDDLEDDQ